MVIPARKNHKSQEPVVGHIYALRNLVERCFNKLKNARRRATRYDKTTESYLGLVQFAAARLWISNLSN